MIYFRGHETKIQYVATFKLCSLPVYCMPFAYRLATGVDLHRRKHNKIKHEIHRSKYEK